MRLYVIRHGETDHNVARRIQGPLLDDPVNALGRQQAAALQRHFEEECRAGLRLDAVYASPMKRAWETAEAVARGCGIAAPVPEPGIIEFSWGIYLGRHENDVMHAMQEAHTHWKAGRVDFALPEGESPASAWERARAALWPIFERHARGGVALVAHGRINKIILSALVHQDLRRMEEFPQGNTSVTLLERDDDAPLDAAWRVRYVNRKDHLAALPTGVPDRPVEGDAPLV